MFQLIVQTSWLVSSLLCMVCWLSIKHGFLKHIWNHIFLFLVVSIHQYYCWFILCCPFIMYVVNTPPADWRTSAQRHFHITDDNMSHLNAIIQFYSIGPQLRQIWKAVNLYLVCGLYKYATTLIAEDIFL